jgi:hypothetical protein
MGLDDRPCPPRMRLIRFRLIKSGLHRPPRYCITAASSIAIITTAPRTDRATTLAITMNNRFNQNKPVHQALMINITQCDHIGTALSRIACFT